MENKGVVKISGVFSMENPHFRCWKSPFLRCFLSEDQLPPETTWVDAVNPNALETQNGGTLVPYVCPYFECISPEI